VLSIIADVLYEMEEKRIRLDVNRFKAICASKELHQQLIGVTSY
jgi:hypothetical protein